MAATSTRTSPFSCTCPLPISFVIKFNLESNFQLVSPRSALSNFNVNIVFSVRRHRHRHRQLIGFRGSSKREAKRAGGRRKKRRKGNAAQETKEKIKFPRYEKMRRNDKSENKY